MLAVSDSPETIDSLPLTLPGESTYTLYKCEVPLPTTTGFRLWPFNVRAGTDPFYSMIALSAVNGSADISQYVHEERNSGNWAADGVCLSKVQLYQTFGPAAVGPHIDANETILWKETANQHGLMQAVLQFTAQPSAPIDPSKPVTLRIRFLASPTTALSGAWSDPVASLGDHPHVRNWHPYSSLVLSGGTFDAFDGGQPGQLRIGVCQATGPEHGADGFQKQVGNADPYGTAVNKGCYGANLEYDFVLTNSGGQNYPVFVYVEAAPRQPAWRGAIRIAEPGGYSARAVAGGGILAGSEFVFARLSSNDDDTERPILVPPGSSVPLKIELANAGTASTPFNLTLSRLSIQPLEGGQ